MSRDPLHQCRDLPSTFSHSSLLSFLLADRILAELPADSLGAYVISMARTASDVLAVVLLQRECGVKVRRCDRVQGLGLGVTIGCHIDS